MDPAVATLAEIAKVIGAPTAIAFAAVWFYAKHLAPKANGKETKEITQHLDLKLTGHFDQLRRDLETKIEKTVESKLTAYFLQLELDRVRREQQ